jgi:hypothetical protein
MCVMPRIINDNDSQNVRKLLQVVFFLHSKHRGTHLFSAVMGSYVFEVPFWGVVYLFWRTLLYTVWFLLELILCGTNIQSQHDLPQSSYPMSIERGHVITALGHNPPERNLKYITPH